MNQQPFSDPTFHEALTRPPTAGSTPPPALRDDHFAAWRDALGADEPGKLEKRLHWEGLDPAEAALRLAGTVATEAEATGEEARDPLPLQAWLREAAPVVDGELEDPEGAPLFAELWSRLAARAREELEAALPPATFAAMAPGREPLRDLEQSLLRRLARIGQGVLWKKFEERRTPGEVFLAHLGLGGDAPARPRRDKYLAFLEELRAEGLAGLLREFPVLGRHLHTVITLWQLGSREMLERVSADREDLAATFGFPPGSVLVAVRQELSDPHRGGRAVAVLSFRPAAEGDEAPVRVVYKPKDMRLDAAYQEALRHTGLGADDAPLRSLQVLPREGYGYMEFVEHRTCGSEEELARFYRNAGRLTAFLHLLACTDCHHENLIAAGEELILIDTETLFEGEHARALSAAEEPPAQSELQQRLGRSVLRSGLLPQWMFMGKAKTAMDISALGIAPPTEATRTVPDYLGRNSDGMMVGTREVPAFLPTSLPTGVGERNRLADFQEAFLAGFRDQATRLREDADSWTGADGILATFKGLTRRIVLRATRIYFTLQEEALLPDRLRSEWTQGLVLEKLHRATLVAPERPPNWPVGLAEIAQMEQLDIPFFEHRIDSGEIFLGGQGSLKGLIETTGYDTVLGNFRELSGDSIDLQCALIRGVVAARRMRASARTTEPVGDAPAEPSRAPSPAPPSLHQRRAEAVRIADELLGSALGSASADGDLEWLGMDLGADNDKFTFGPLGPSLYGGSTGIALFLEVLASTGAGQPERYRAAARAALRPILRLFGEGTPGEWHRWWRDQSLGLSGCGGVLLALTSIAQLDEEVDAIFREGWPRALAALHPEFVRKDHTLDLMGGTSGLVGPLLSVPGEVPAELLESLGEHLVAQQGESGGWQGIQAPGSPPLTGLSHGAAGIAAALARLSTVTGKRSFGDAARRGLAYERSCFDEDEGNWPDFRSHTSAPTGKPTFMSSWCHGSAGIALGRASLMGTDLWDETAREESLAALRNVARRPSSIDHLCCGRMGQAVILEAVGALLGERELEAAGASLRAETVAAGSAGNGSSYHFFRTAESNLSLPGLFTGHAGIGLALLPEGRDSLLHILSVGLPLDRGSSSSSPLSVSHLS